MQTTQEKVGDVILGTHLEECYHDTRWTSKGKLVLVRSPLKVGTPCSTIWTETQRKDGGWERKVQHQLDTSAYDVSRRISKFKVVRVSPVPSSDGYGGGVEITVSRLGGKKERIVYTRRCAYRTDVSVPVQIVSSSETAGAP